MKTATRSTRSRSRSWWRRSCSSRWPSAALGRIDFRLQFAIDWHDPRIKQVFMLMLPVTIGLGIVNLDQLINSVFGTLVSKEAPRAIDNAFRIYMLPQGLFSVAVATVLFPTLSRMASRRDAGGDAPRGGDRHAPDQPAADPRGGLHDRARRRRSCGSSSNAGRSTPSRPHLVSIALFWFAFSLPFGGLNLLLTRTFFAVQRPWIPTRLAAMNIVGGHHRQHRPVQAVRDRRADHRHGRRERRDDRRCCCSVCAPASTGAWKGPRRR